MGEFESYVLKNGILVTPFETLEGFDILIKDGKINGIFRKGIKVHVGGKHEVIDLDGEYYVTPGLIDIHTHGGGGEDCVGGNLEVISKYKIRQGVTGYLPTLIASPLEYFYQSFDSIFEFKNETENVPTAQVLGIHIEGVYLSEKYRGAQRLDFLRKPSVLECREIIDRSHGLLKIMTLAPEVDGCLDIVELLTGNGIISSVGHSNASVEVMDIAVSKGLSHVTHSFNAMGEMGFAEPGVRSPNLEGYILVRDELKLEVISELTHVSPIILELIYRAKGCSNVIIITDSMSVSGLPPGEYKIGVMTLVLEENSQVARLKDGGLAGSVIYLNKAVKNFYENTSATLNDAIRMASYNPAQSLGLSNQKGSIEIGKDADLAIFDKNLDTHMVFVKGLLAYVRD